MYFYSEKNVIINEDSLELIYFFIPNYTVFKEFGISLFPKYSITVNEFDFNNETIKITITEKENFIDLFQKEKINLKIICGKNGSGKTTLLKLISGEIQPAFNHRRKRSNIKELLEKKSPISQALAKIDEPDTRYECIYIFKDKADNFISNKKTIINYNNKTHNLDSTDNHISFTANTVCVTHKNMGIQDFSIDNNIVGYYRDYSSVFKGILPDSTPLFTNFEISLKDFHSEVDDLLNSNLKNLLSVYEKNDLLSIFNSNWILYYYLNCLRDTAYENFIDGIRQDLENPDDFLDTLECSLKNVIELDSKLDYEEFLEEINGIKNRSYLLKDFDVVQDKIDSISKKIEKLICTAIREDYNLSFGFRSFIKFTGYYYNNGERRYFNDLSTGEQLQFIYRYQIFHSMYQKERLYWYIDEPEEGLHPEWCRTFIRDYLNSYENIKEIVEKNKKYLSTKFNKDKRVTLIFSTHSPFILSDVTNDYVIYLDKDSETNYTSEIFDFKDSFAGNIGEMFTENFFMEKTIGEHASIFLKQLVENLLAIEPIEEERYKEYKKIINSIGDDLLRSLLLEKLEQKNDKN